MRQLRQIGVPKAFRIDAEPLDAALIEVLLTPPPTDPPPPLPPPPLPPGVALGDDEIRRMATELHRLRINQLQVDDEAIRRRMGNQLNRVMEVLEKQGVEVRDLTGQEYHAGRLDTHEPPPPEIRADLERPMILRCSEPVVLRRGQLLQKARVMVGMPSK
jgi:hypothetical protein